MRHTLLAASLLLSVALTHSAPAQDLGGSGDLKLQIHGFATQGFIYTTKNNWATADSSDGSAAFTEAVVNVSAQPETKLRIGVQARYFLLGDYGNKITLDWAQADYKLNEYLGFRVGKVKSPTSLFNEIQDIDSAYLWILLPQSVYNLPSRSDILAHNGGNVYGRIGLGETMGKLEYRGFGGERVISADDGYLQAFRDLGLSAPNGVKGPAFGGMLIWRAPLHDLSFGASENSGRLGDQVIRGTLQGQQTTTKYRQTHYFTTFEKHRVMLAGEFSRFQVDPRLVFPGLPPITLYKDTHSFYVMASYHATTKLSTGLYYSSSIDTKAQRSSARYQKDWALAARYDFSPSLYAKVEQHFIDGTELNYSTLDNPDLQPNTRMTLLKVGVSF